MLQTHGYRLQRKKVIDYDVLLTMVWKTDGTTLKMNRNFHPIFGKGELEAFGIEDSPCCNNRRWFLPFTSQKYRR